MLMCITSGFFPGAWLVWRLLQSSTHRKWEGLIKLPTPGRVYGEFGVFLSSPVALCIMFMVGAGRPHKSGTIPVLQLLLMVPFPPTDRRAFEGGDIEGDEEEED